VVVFLVEATLEDSVQSDQVGSYEVVVFLVDATGLEVVVVQSSQVWVVVVVVVVLVAGSTGSADQSDQLAEAVPARPRARTDDFSNFMIEAAIGSVLGVGRVVKSDGDYVDSPNN
jgi:hypothetical protein